MLSGVMRFAALSDIHGNIDALEAVLAHARAQGINQFVNLGDICSGPLFPVETIERLMALDMPTIRGNHERQLLETSPERMGASDRYAADRLQMRHRHWLQSLRAQLSPFRGVLMVHGTPASDLDYYLHTVTSDGLRPATPDEITRRTGTNIQPLILCGHTHIPAMHRREDGGLIVNPGSVGLPAYDDIHPYPHAVETGTPDARYAVLSSHEGHWSAQFHCVPYDFAPSVRQAQANHRPDWAIALATGTMTGSAP